MFYLKKNLIVYYDVGIGEKIMRKDSFLILFFVYPHLINNCIGCFICKSVF